MGLSIVCYSLSQDFYKNNPSAKNAAVNRLMIKLLKLKFKVNLSIMIHTNKYDLKKAFQDIYSQLFSFPCIKFCYKFSLHTHQQQLKKIYFLPNSVPP